MLLCSAITFLVMSACRVVLVSSSRLNMRVLASDQTSMVKIVGDSDSDGEDSDFDGFDGYDSDFDGVELGRLVREEKEDMCPDILEEIEEEMPRSTHSWGEYVEETMKEVANMNEKRDEKLDGNQFHLIEVASQLAVCGELDQRNLEQVMIFLQLALREGEKDSHRIRAAFWIGVIGSPAVDSAVDDLRHVVNDKTASKKLRVLASKALESLGGANVRPSESFLKALQDA